MRRVGRAAAAVRLTPAYAARMASVNAKGGPGVGPLPGWSKPDGEQLLGNQLGTELRGDLDPDLPLRRGPGRS